MMTVRVLLSFLLLLAGGAAFAQSLPPLVTYRDTDTGFVIDYPFGWRHETGDGPTRLLIGEPPDAAFVLCTVEHAVHEPRLLVPQARLDRDLVAGFRTRTWPQQLAGKRNVLAQQVREIGGVPMGAIDWERDDTRDGKPVHARGIKVFRPTPAALWSAECAAIGHSRETAEAHFARSIEVIGAILGSVKFPRLR